jgi:hypothetical protein
MLLLHPRTDMAKVRLNVCKWLVIALHYDE